MPLICLSLADPERTEPQLWGVDLLLLHEGAQTGEGVVPLCGDLVEIMAGVGEAMLVELPDGFAAAAGAADQAGMLHHAQVLGDGLAGDARAFGEACDGLRAIVAQAGDETEAGLVAESGEDRRGSSATGSAQRRLR